MTMTEDEIQNKFHRLIQIIKSMQYDIRTLNDEIAALRSDLDKKTSGKSPESRSSGSDGSDRSDGSVIQIVKSPVANWRKVLEQKQKNAASKSKSKKKSSLTPKQKRQAAALLQKYSISPSDI